MPVQMGPWVGLGKLDGRRCIILQSSPKERLVIETGAKSPRRANLSTVLRCAPDLLEARHEADER